MNSSQCGPDEETISEGKICMQKHIISICNKGICYVVLLYIIWHSLSAIRSTEWETVIPDSILSPHVLATSSEKVS